MIEFSIIEKLFKYIQYNYNINGKLTAMAAYGQIKK
jgi:hypothetical protein